MPLPDRLAWGRVPDDVQMAMFRHKLQKTIAAKRPPLPASYASDLVADIMDMVEGWEWWQRRWYAEWDDWEQRRNPETKATPPERSR